MHIVSQGIKNACVDMDTNSFDPSCQERMLPLASSTFSLARAHGNGSGDYMECGGRELDVSKGTGMNGGNGKNANEDGDRRWEKGSAVSLFGRGLWQSGFQKRCDSLQYS